MSVFAIYLTLSKIPPFIVLFYLIFIFVFSGLGCSYCMDFQWRIQEIGSNKLYTGLGVCCKISPSPHRQYHQCAIRMGH